MKKFTIAMLLIAATLMISVPVKVQAATGWQFINGYWYYYYTDTYYAADVTTSPEDNGKLFCFDEYGRMKTGWIRYDNAGEVKWRYANENGVIQKNWQKINGKWYYFDPYDYYMYSNWYGKINGKYYFLNKNGSMGIGWCHYVSDYGYDIWYYADSNGVLQTGWQKINGKWYYFDKVSHLMLRGAQQSGSVCYIEGKYYFLEHSGAMKTGWCKFIQEYDGQTHVEWYYANDNGELAKGWKKINGKWYYFDPSDRRMNTSTFLSLDGKMYYFEASGAMKTGWIKHPYEDEEGNTHYVWFYAYSDGALRSGWEKINGKWYYFNPEAYDMISGGFHKIGSDAFFFADSGAMMYGWCNQKYTVGGKTYSIWYYAGSGGRLVTGWKNIDGVNYYFDPTNYYLVISE